MRGADSEEIECEYVCPAVTQLIVIQDFTRNACCHLTAGISRKWLMGNGLGAWWNDACLVCERRPLACVRPRVS